VKRLSLLERIEKYTQVTGYCWLWTGTLSRGYGHVKLHGEPKTTAHRAVYQYLVGPIPDGLVLDHLCRVRNCVNPDHLEPITVAENVRRGFGPTALAARKTHCKRGHEFTPENTYMQSKGRECRTCKVMHAQVNNKKRYV
jgi:hypothetical protein